MTEIDLSSVTTAIHLCAPNDRNGNPNRGYVAFAGQYFRGYWPESYAGYCSVPAELRELAYVAPRINVSADELRSWANCANDLIPDFCN